MTPNKPRALGISHLLQSFQATSSTSVAGPPDGSEDASQWRNPDADNDHEDIMEYRGAQFRQQDLQAYSGVDDSVLALSRARSTLAPQVGSPIPNVDPSRMLLVSTMHASPGTKHLLRSLTGIASTELMPAPMEAPYSRRTEVQPTSKAVFDAVSSTSKSVLPSATGSAASASNVSNASLTQRSELTSNPSSDHDEITAVIGAGGGKTSLNRTTVGQGAATRVTTSPEAYDGNGIPPVVQLGSVRYGIMHAKLNRTFQCSVLQYFPSQTETKKTPSRSSSRC